MPTYVAKYLVVDLDSPPYEPHPTSKVTIAGHSITSVGWSTTFGGINRYELQGLVDVKTLTSKELYGGASWDPVGTTFYGYSKQMTINDPSLIPPEYRPPGHGTSGPFTYDNADQTEASFGPVTYDFETRVSGSISFGSLVASSGDTMAKLVENAAKAAGFSGLATAINNVAAAKNALENVTTKGMQLIEEGVRGISNPHYSHRDYDAKVDQFFKDAGASFKEALIDQNFFPGNPTAEQYADNILNGIVLIGSGESIEAGVSAQLGVRLEAGPIVIEAVVEGTAKADVIIRPGANDTTINGGDGNDHIVSGSGADRIRGGDGNDYIFGGRGNDIIEGGDSTTLYSYPPSGPPQIFPGNFLNGGAGADTAVFDGNFGAYLSNSSGVGGAYLWGDDESTFVKDIETLKFADGTVNLRRSNPLVDNLFYAADNDDIFARGADAGAHYGSWGWREGRDPNAYFSTRGYQAANGDVQRANVNPLAHYDASGWREGRDASADFDTTLYLIHNPDVAAARMNPLFHYLNWGQAEQREAHAAIGRKIVNGFDAEYYLLTNQDVARAGVNPYDHFVKFGWKEGRDPNAYFDTSGYLDTYGDVKAAGVNPLFHYKDFGWREGRDPSAHFDGDGYLYLNSDVKAAGANPLMHFLNHGAYEMRDTWDDSAFGHPTPVVFYDF